MKKRIAAILILVLVITLIPGYSFADTKNIDEDEEMSFVSADKGVFVNPAYSDVLSEDDIIENVSLHSGSAFMSTRKQAIDSSLFESDESIIVENIRNSMTNRENLFWIRVCSDNKVGEEEINEWIDQAFAETESPVQGDYLRWVYGGCSYNWESDFEDGKYYTTVQVDMYYYTTREQEETLTEMFDQVMDSFGFTDSTTAYDKAYTIYDYICSNVAYDYQNLNDDTYTLKYTAYAALVDKTAVCQGYATLLYRMLKTAGLDTRIITGVSHGENHAWNIVGLGDEYYLLDSTWDAGANQYSFFLKGSNYFTDHESEEYFLSDIFTNNYPISEENYKAADESIIQSGNFKYLISDSKAKLIKYSGTDTDVTVPSSIEGYPVKGIGISAFQYCDTIEYLRISEGIEFLEQEAIFGCSGLKEIYFPASLSIPLESTQGFVTGISYIPNYCQNLEKIVVADDNQYLTDIDGILFDNGMTCILCYPAGRTANEYSIPDGIKVIGSSSFENNSYIEKITMPETVTYIGYWAFNGCGNLKDINISRNCTSIGQYAFNCTSITKMEIPASLTVIASPMTTESPVLTEWIVDADNAYYSSFEGILLRNTSVIHIPPAKEGDLILPESVLTIEKKAALYTSISSITIPAQTTISSENFESYTKDFTIYGYEGSPAQKFAESHSIPFVVIGEIAEEEIASGSCGNSVTWSLNNKGLLSIKGKGEMYWEIEFGDTPWQKYMKQITKVVIEDGVENIYDRAFADATALTEVIIPGSVRIICDSAFNMCSSLCSIVIPEGVEEIGDYAFSDCRISSINLPSTLRKINGNPFGGCSLESVTVEQSNNYYIARDNVLYDKEMKTLVFFPPYHREYYYIPDGVEVIGSESFNKAVVSILYLPDSLKTIKRNAFINSGVGRIYLGDKVIDIEPSAFFSSQGLESIVFGSSVKTIKEGAFAGLYSLKNVYYKGTKNDWDKIEISDYNEHLYSADIIYTDNSALCNDGIHHLKKIEDTGALCTENGYKEHYFCLKCGKRFSSYEWQMEDDNLEILESDVLIPAIGSHLEMIRIDAKEPTCTDNGNIEYWTCSRCHKRYNDAAGTKEYTENETIVNALGHDWSQWTVVKEPTLSEEGLERRICANDPSHVEERAIPKITPKIGWIQKDDGKWTYVKEDGTLATGWTKVGKKWYHMDPDGNMQTGWQKIGTNWYYFNNSGVMQTGWLKLSNKWYYFNTSGMMQTGWQKISGKQYFFKTSGVMAANEWVKGYYWINKDGTWTYKYKASWKKSGKKWWFGDTSGWYARNTTITIDGKKYTFDKSGWMV